MARQAALERPGWVFWRVFGSQWKADPDYWWRRLVERLEQCGVAPIGSAAINEVHTEHRVIRAGGKPVIVADPECVAHPVVGDGEAVEGADGRLATSVQPSATPAPMPEVRPAAEPVVPIPTIPLPSPVPAAAPSEPAPLAPSAAPGQQVLPSVGAENLSAESLPVDETGFHLEETQPEIVGPDMAVVLFYPETRNRRTIRISSHEDAPDSNVHSRGSAARAGPDRRHDRRNGGVGGLRQDDPDDGRANLSQSRGGGVGEHHQQTSEQFCIVFAVCSPLSKSEIRTQQPAWEPYLIEPSRQDRTGTEWPK